MEGFPDFARQFGFQSFPHQIGYPFPDLLSPKYIVSIFGIVFEQGVAPRRPLREHLSYRNGWRTGAVYRRTTGGIGDDHTITEKLRCQLHIGVSPQPGKLPLNSNSGRINWLPFKVFGSCTSFSVTVREKFPVFDSISILLRILHDQSLSGRRTNIGTLLQPVQFIGLI